MPGQGSTRVATKGTTETTPTLKAEMLTKNRLFTFPNGLLTKVGLVYSTTKSTVTSPSNATLPTELIPGSSQADVQPSPPTQNPTASSSSLSPSPSQRLLKGLTERSSFYTGTFNSAHSGSRSGFSTYHTPAASLGSFSSEAGLGLIRRSEVGGGAGSSRYSGVGTVTTEGGEWELYDAHTDISASGSQSVSVKGLGFGSRSASSSSLGVRGMAGSRIVSGRISSVGLRNGDGLEEADRSGSGEPRRTSLLATHTHLTVHGAYDAVCGDFTTNKGSHNTDEREEGFIPTSTRFTTPPGDNDHDDGDGSVFSDGDEYEYGCDEWNGTGNQSESSGSTVTITPARLMMFGSSSSLSLPSISTSRAAHAHPSSSSSKSALTAHSRLASAISSGASYQPARGPALFLTSAKTGFNVEEVFQYVARRVVERWDEEDDDAEADAEVSGSARGGMEVGGNTELLPAPVGPIIPSMRRHIHVRVSERNGLDSPYNIVLLNTTEPVSVAPLFKNTSFLEAPVYVPSLT
ncbi:hypothetical protein BJ165DRAFT_1532642 [Panaeolus papilionaceus]|nr:hypothetical protein BJ165DRAFT_1532642 [Panaeolus papilionaceus]